MARRMTRKQTLFFAPTSKKLARQISITSPATFRQSIRTIKQGGVTLKESRALVLAQNRARAQLNRTNLSIKERIEFTKIAMQKLPKVSKR